MGFALFSFPDPQPLLFLLTSLLMLQPSRNFDLITDSPLPPSVFHQHPTCAKSCPYFLHVSGFGPLFSVFPSGQIYPSRHCHINLLKSLVRSLAGGGRLPFFAWPLRRSTMLGKCLQGIAFCNPRDVCSPPAKLNYSQFLKCSQGFLCLDAHPFCLECSNVQPSL